MSCQTCLIFGTTVGIVVDIDRDNLGRSPHPPSNVGGALGNFCRALLKLMINYDGVDFAAGQRTLGPESFRTGPGGQGQRIRTTGKPNDDTAAQFLPHLLHYRADSVPNDEEMRAAVRPKRSIQRAHHLRWFPSR